MSARHLSQSSLLVGGMVLLLSSFLGMEPSWSMLIARTQTTMLPTGNKAEIKKESLSLRERPSITDRRTPLDLDDVDVDLVLFGDSMMSSALAPILRSSWQTDGRRVVPLVRAGTGLARPDVFDWGQRMIQAPKTNLMIGTLGTNDGQDILDHGRVFSFGSEAWNQVYTERVKTFVANARERTNRLVLLVPPRFVSQRLTSKVEHIMSLWEIALEGADFVQIVRMDDFLLRDQKNTRLAQQGFALFKEDGVHLTREAALRIAQGLEKRLL